MTSASDWVTRILDFCSFCSEDIGSKQHGISVLDDLGQVRQLLVDRVARMLLPLLPQQLLQLRQPQARVLHFEFRQTDLLEVLERGAHPLLRVKVDVRRALAKPGN